MNTFSDFDIEHYVRFPEEWEGERKLGMLSFLERDEVARDLEAYYREFYNKLDMLQRPEMLVLDLKKPEEDQTGIIVLAADSAMVSKEQLQTMATFTSEDNQMVIRFLYHLPTKSYELHTLSGLSEAEELVILTFRNADNEFVLPANGKITNIEEQELKKVVWETEQIHLRFPVANYNLVKANESLSEDENFHFQSDGDLVRFRSGRKGVSRLIMHEEGRSPTMYRLENGETMCEIKPGVNVNCYLYT